MLKQRDGSQDTPPVRDPCNCLAIGKLLRLRLASPEWETAREAEDLAADPPRQTIQIELASLLNWTSR
jgi:hypothetical protein